MKILSISTNDTSGGAAIAALRLNKALRGIGHDVTMSVSNKTSNMPWVTEYPKPQFWPSHRLDRIPLQLYPKREKTNLFSPGLIGSPPLLSMSPPPDIVHMHWIQGGFFSIKALAKIQPPLIWTLHDMWAMTGGCHYPGTCHAYADTCQQCPILGSTTKDLSTWLQNQKALTWKKIMPNTTLVSPSHWLAKQAKKSSLLKSFDIRVIPNGVDTSQFKYIQQDVAREKFNLPQNKKILLFGAVGGLDDLRKGGIYIRELVKKFTPEEQKSICIAIFGNNTLSLHANMQIISLGVLTEEMLPFAYAAADLFILTSLEDNLPNTALEALCCGTPIIGFDIGGIPEIVATPISGNLVPAKHIDALYQSVISRMNVSTEARLVCSKNAQERFSSHTAAKYYTDLFCEKTRNHNHRIQLSQSDQ